jgi:hypothetical protein
MDTLTLHRDLCILQAHTEALVKTIVFQQGFGDVDGAENFIKVSVVTEHKHHNELEIRLSTIIPATDYLLRELAKKSLHTLADFIDILNESPDVRLGKMQALQELLRK